VVDASGEVIISADSMWFLIDTVRRRPLKVPETMYEAFGIGPDENTALDIRKIERQRSAT
jgi:medium-chain acyl-[acyl-carrier-protein] hydrolase